jgi:hypothetical protein
MFLLVISGVAAAQTDTNYVKVYRNNLVPRVITNYKNQVTSFITKSDTSFSADYFATGGQNFIGAEVSYKWATLGYNVSFTRENSSANMDFRFSTAYKPFRVSANFTSLKNLNYYRVNGMDSIDTIFIARQNRISLRNVGLKVDYILNNNKFYYSPSISQVGRQLKSQGSFIISSGISYQDFDLRGLSDSASFNFHQLYQANRFKILRADLGFGYAYNWVLGKKVVIYISETPNIGVQMIKSSGNPDQNRHTTVSITNYVRAGVVFTWKNKFLGAYAYNAVTAGKWQGFNYNDMYTSVQLHFGMVLKAPKLFSCMN